MTSFTCRIDSEWINCPEVYDLLRFLRKEASPRKLRLFMCACVGLVLDLVSNETSRAAVMEAELFADGLITQDDAYKCFRAAEAVVTKIEELNELTSDYTVSRTAAQAAAYTLSPDISNAPRIVVGCCEDAVTAKSKNRKSIWREEAELLRDIFNPFRRTSSENWPEAAKDKAIEIYENKRFGDIAQLGAILTERGCQDLELIEHCCASGRHVKGCWAIDCILGRV